MKKRRRVSRRKPIDWLPIDSRIFPPIISFGHVKGLARFFLEIEIILSVLVVVGTVVVIVLTLLR
ncbi:hypothetical protein A2973_01595 [Candidatus Gottesmanbacteria bacterium RIFCSPLOWO2_01_FULL_49_10]|uniref:Uncharacterized protein n=1 Tax=Candidatus Gottesmanbacteria bacterium RIFCSPLOWO2_01_FULL_49_10 TaxID=1798396 RepID=A0A1F6AWU9_9BACT|nr:MAG: hypothetical protein UY10_C0034G0006 [Microgenomates group bacterium GW2011_GWA2_47_8]OGG29164.1 MAG: hypothetical protein A2973_01595 [Candidatus Gottesmanbacteria bacterium RIFCSPLOWO2_01_FULL_49_10]